MKKVFIILFFALSSMVSATNYYISSTSGDDNRDGKTEATAWKTISKVNGYTFAAGDIISFECGSIWREQLNITRSGTADTYMIFNSYGSGNKPIILGSNVSSGWTDEGGNIWKSTSTFPVNTRGSNPWYSEIFFYNTNGSISWGDYEATTGSLTAEYDWTWSADYVYVFSTSDPGVRYTKIEIPQRNYCIWLGNENQYIEIDGLELRHARKINVYDNEPRRELYGYTIKNCLLCYVGNKTELDGCGYNHSVARSDMLIQNNEMHNGGRRQISINWYSINNSDWSNITIEGNYLHDGYHGSGMGCDVTDNDNNNVTNVIVRNNIFYQDPDFGTNPGDAKSTFGSFRARATGSSISNVYIYNNVYKYVSNYCHQFVNIDNVYIYNNTFYDLNHNFSTYAWHIQLAGQDGDYNRNVNIKNNIFYNSGVYADNHSVFPIEFSNNQSTSEVYMDYNLFCATDPATIFVNMIDIGGTSYKTANWSTLKSTFGWQAHEPAINSDPLFFNDPDDLHLQNGSPAIGAGIPIPEIATDFEGKPYNNPPSIGAFEYITGSTNNPPAVSITSPVNGSTYTAPATVAITATATDSDGTISKVEFYNGSNKLGEDANSPYTYTWSSVSAGIYSLTAVANDNLNAKKTSAAVSVTVNTGTTNNPPAVSITAPANGAAYTAPATIAITATATDSDGSISKVEFYNGSTKLGEDASSPFTYTWNSVSTGTYSLTAVATDNLNAKTTSAAISVTVNTGTNNNPPAVSITSPGNGTNYTTPATITIAATATDSDGTVSKVEFYNGSAKLGEDISSPYTYTYNSVSAGTYSFTAVATDDLNAKTTSTAILVSVNNGIPGENQPPVITITSPTKNSSYLSPATIEIEAFASDADGTISKVEFVNGNIKLSELTSAPYTYSWKDVGPGTYSITAIATDNLNATTASSAVEVTVSLITPVYDPDSEIINLYPNPSDGNFTIELLTPMQSEKNIINIVNITGETVYKGILLKEENIRQFNLSHLNPGMYILLITGDEIIVTKKLMKK